MKIGNPQSPRTGRSALAVLSLLALAVPPARSLTASPAEPELVAHWTFDRPPGEEPDAHRGNVEAVPGVFGQALKFDGFTGYGERALGRALAPDGGFTVGTWVALASYPWDWSPVADCSRDELAGFFLGINREGKAGFKLAAGSSWYELETETAIPLGRWVHIAAAFSPGDRMVLYINGEPAAARKITGNYVPPRENKLWLGRNARPRTWVERQLVTENALFFLDGIVDDLRIHAGVRRDDEIRREYAAVPAPPLPALSDRRNFPIGAAGGFGAFHARLDYYKEWDDLWKVGPFPDVFVRFDDSPVQLVFWRGTGYVPCWVSENRIWYLNEWLETWGGDVASCAEPLMDRICQYSHVRIIENTAARVVIHWRYALNDAFYEIAGRQDNSRGEWCDEYHIIYPDQVGVRRMDLHYSKPERKHDWVEQIVLLPPGKRPADVIDPASVTLVNLAGETAAYTWDEHLQREMPEPRGANISLVNLKSVNRPFLVVSPNPVRTVEGTWDGPYFRTYGANMAQGFREDPPPSPYGWWNHWPVAQIPGDGRWVVTPDHPSHFNLTTFVQWEDHARTDTIRTRIMLQGMTARGAKELVPLAKSWLKPPGLELPAGAYRGGAYDPAERAYVLQRTDSAAAAALTFTIRAGPETPLLNPAVIVRNWGRRQAELRLDGRKVPEGKDFRQGLVARPEGEDLVLWLRLERATPTAVTIDAK